ncbi:putative transporter small subunit [Speluncibacter jeojiensis]|uniref:Transporter small subunit n=1 Tax=Speluncibacter jeojiensis TaxID=2710754 RepID=A0A9X4RDC3_9ACTN|nr:putative transporter small subunit [Rhodococcus sp. D2-41]MDG3014017.1 putative transporter small subunit [Corynebacteriales bacterium D3-21]
MTTVLMTLYILMWPVMAGIVLVILTVGVVKDIVRARRNGESFV